MTTPPNDAPWRLPLWIGTVLLLWFVVNGQTHACRAAIDGLSSTLGR